MTPASIENESLIVRNYITPSVYADITESDLHENVMQEEASGLTHQISELAQGALAATKKAIPTGLIYLDHLLDLVPLGSTASNIVDLGLKHAVITVVDPNQTCFKPFIEHLQNKDSKVCMIYGIPFIGNVAKLGSLVQGLFSKPPEPQPQEVQEPEVYGMSTIGMRLRQYEQQSL
jgi:hypothetical protein